MLNTDEVPEEIKLVVHNTESHKPNVVTATQPENQRMQLKIVKHTYGQPLSDSDEQKVVFVDRAQDTYTSLLQEVFKQFLINQNE